VQIKVSECTPGSQIRDIAEPGIAKLERNINTGGWSADSTVLCWEDKDWAREQKFVPITELYMQQLDGRPIGTDFHVKCPSKRCL
jgi:hypothetical protein